MKTIVGPAIPRSLGVLKKLAQTLCLTALALSPTPNLSAAQSVQLAWDPSPDPSAAGYLVRYGTTSRNPSFHLDVGTQTTARIPNLVEGLTYHFMVTAYNLARIESDPSNEISYQVPPLPAGSIRLERSPTAGTPARLRVALEAGRQFAILASENLRTWTVIHSGISPAGGVLQVTDSAAARLPRRFYRLATVPRTITSILSIEPRQSSAAPVRLRYSVRSGLSFHLQASTDLWTWTTLRQGVSTSEAWQEYSDPVPPALPGRFYRLAHP